MITDDERRKIAQMLRDDAESGALPYSDFLGAVAYDVGVEKECAAVLNRLADLIEPTCEVRRSTLFYPASSSVPEYEETVYRCGRCGEIVSYDEDYDPETDLPAYCERCGSRITGIGEPWDE